RSLGGQRVDADLVVVRLARPVVSVLRPIGHEQQDANWGQTLDEIVEKGLRLPVNPVQILEDQQERLRAAFEESQMLEGVKRTLATARGIEGAPLRILDRDVQELKQTRQH